MATLVNRSGGDYPPGTELKIGSRTNKTIAAFLKQNKPRHIKLSDEKPTEEFGEGKFSIVLDLGKIIVKVNGSASALDSFALAGGGGKSDTHDKTRVSEAASLIAIDWYLNKNKTPTAKEVYDELPKHKAKQDLWDISYYDSAILQAKAIKRIRVMRGKKYDFEFQGDAKSNPIYVAAKKISGISARDNWNPGDLWAFRRGKSSQIPQEIKKSGGNIKELNFLLRKHFMMGNVVSISLKKSRGKAVAEVVDPIKYRNKKLEYDFAPLQANVADSLKSVFFNTKSGFQFKINARASATTLNYNVEGTMKSESFSMGAVPAELWSQYHSGKVYGGVSSPKSDQQLKKARVIYDKFKKSRYFKDTGNLSAVLDSPEDLNDLMKRRYIILASIIDFVLFGKNKYVDIMRWGFFASMKVTDKSSIYLKVK